MKFQNIARRDVLRAAACSAVALPLLQLIRGSRSADAAATAYPRRMIIYATTNSGWPEQFWPRLPGQAPIPKKEAAGWYTSGNTALDTADFTLSPILQPLASHRERMLILEGVDGFDGGHAGYSSLLNGRLTGDGLGGMPGDASAVGGPTLDHILAKELNLAAETRFANLQFGVNASASPLSFYGPAMSAPAEDDPLRMYERVFGSFAVTPAETAVQDRLLARRRSVLDAAAKQLLELQAKLPLREDREKLSNFLDSIRSLEQSIGKTGGGGSLAACGKPPAPPKLDPKSDADAPAIAKAQMETMILAMACDLTRVATFQFYEEGNGFTHPWLGVTAGHHNELGHGDPADLAIQEQILKIETWHSEQVAYMLDRLASIPEGTGSMLDNTLVVFMQTHTRGHTHSNMNLNLVLAGNLGGNLLKKGRYIRFPRAQTGDDRSVGGEATTPLGLARTSSDLCFTIMQGSA